MERYMAHLLKGAEYRTKQFMESQVGDPASLQYGGIKGDIWEAKPKIYAMTSALAVYFHKDSCFYKNEQLYAAVNLALDFIERTQREDGSFDYPSCNFKSAADTSFCFKRLIAAYRLLVKYGDSSDEAITVLKEKYLTIMHKALDAIREGGFHTPNHRWGIAAALLQGSNLFAEEDGFAAGLKARADQYLAEGIDGDEDGEYAERSTGNYNAVVNNAMMAMYQETGDEAFLGYVERNLSMMLTYMDPDDTIFTQNSTRQDQGKLEYADKYFYQYLYMCSREHCPAFDGAAHKIIKDNMERGDLAPDCLHIVMNHDEMMGYHFKEYGFLEEYRKFFRHAGVLRVRKPSYTYTVLNGKSAFLYFKSQGTMLCVKIGESCCDIRNFIPQTIEELPDGCRLEAEAESWYYLPFKEKQDTSDWWKMDQTKREKLISSRLKTTLEIREKDQGLELHLKAEGLDRLPLRLEICIPAGVTLEHPAFALEAAAGEGMILKDGYLEVHDGSVTMEIGPGFGEHSFKGHYSGEEINSAGYTVYANGYTPLEKHFSLMVK
ncbi:hypothetical protein ADH76_01935 [Enterocloster clostridioformis]|uniref:hypothetical protein n=1 Tax=Enterocloster clostridioformis TaxID=1531 RepID=UPI00080C9720|nr:hypothetical protein [Enterocloster clostridioformis]ANU44851.1 hypothetical protein A4V08_02475 [Lachnoclostridium sp. YL32]NDO27780.1 hypothetical protein [Enterocloster clostridioformis]OXE70242.1 hypothetical protein ADH76_01935 [Enterocloster clostridioformis]QQR00389.1 hypothetical protein I5Q83_32185 [Enterocloster clostridioformis]